MEKERTGTQKPGRRSREKKEKKPSEGRREGGGLSWTVSESEKGIDCPTLRQAGKIRLAGLLGGGLLFWALDLRVYSFDTQIRALFWSTAVSSR